MGGYVYGFFDPKKKRALLGLSPEFLYTSKSDGTLWTTAVAGSQRASQFKKWSAKLKLEHKLVEESVKDSLSEKVEFSSAKTLKYGDLVHLCSEGKISQDLTHHQDMNLNQDLDMNMDLNQDLNMNQDLNLNQDLNMNMDLNQIAKRLHPTAAVGTLPKKAYESLNLGPEPRGFYGGYAELQKIDLPFSLVTIRGLEWNGGELRASIGGGVLQESLLDEEWEELNFKWAQFKKLWGI